MKYIVVDKEIERGFITGDQKVVGAIIGRSHRTVEGWLYNADYINMDRFIIIRNPQIIKSRHGGKITDQFLKHKFKKK